jgi:HNH endonuclease
MGEPSSEAVRSQMTPKSLMRIYNKIEFPPEASGCWIWKATKNTRGGYGRVRFQGRLWLAHRLLYKLLIGEIPTGLTLDHLCRTTACTNPTHLEPVSIGVNIRRSARLCRVCGQALMREGKNG